MGVLDGLTILELAGIGPVPFACMMLADHGARVIRIERPAAPGGGGDPVDFMTRSRTHVTLDLKRPEDVRTLRDLAGRADAIVEGYRPGVMERLGLGPDTLLADNPALVYGRMTGWGQDGRRATLAGHDINYIAMSGALHGFGRKGDKPVAPANLVGDFGGGGMMLAFGVVAALLHVRSGGRGQVIDCAMVDGAALLSTMTYGRFATGLLKDERGVNKLDSGAHFYDTYETSDGRWVAIGCIEPQFYALFLSRVGLSDDPLFASQSDQALWPMQKARLADLFLTRSRDEWCELLDECDSCFAPVLSLAESPEHPDNRARGMFVQVDGYTMPAPAPRFLGTPADMPRLGVRDAPSREEGELPLR